MCHIKQFASCTEGGSYTNNELSWGYFNHKSVKDSHSIQHEKKKDIRQIIVVLMGDSLLIRASCWIRRTCVWWYLLDLTCLWRHCYCCETSKQNVNVDGKPLKGYFMKGRALKIHKTLHSTFHITVWYTENIRK